MGIDAKKDVALNTTFYPGWRRWVSKILTVGTDGMHMMESAGFSTRSESPEYVVLGYDTEINYEKLTTASITSTRSSNG